jgi:ornithine carbamoyltransferase
MNHLLTIGEYSQSELQAIIDLSVELQNEPQPVLTQKNVLFVFEKPSLRTKVGTEAAINHLGGNVIHIGADVIITSGKAIPFSCRESIADAMKNVSQWCDAVFARVYSHQTLSRMAQFSDIPIVNALCDKHHPMQALADLLTIQQNFGKEAKVVITYVGDANNVAFSLAEIALIFGHEFRFSGPENYMFSIEQQDHFQKLAALHGGFFMQTGNTYEAVASTDVIYTDTFISMGEEHLYEDKMAHFKGYQVNEELFGAAKNTTGFMHCLPAHRGVEVTDGVIDHPNSWVYQQAKNRMIVSKGVFATLISNQQLNTVKEKNGTVYSI